MLMRLVIIVVYIISFVTLRTYLRNHPPRLKNEYIKESIRLGPALWRMWGLLLWPLPGLMWIGMTPIPDWIIASFSIFIPLSVFLVFLQVTGIIESSIGSGTEGLVESWGIALGPVLVILLNGIALIQYSFSILQFIAFLVFVTFPPVLVVLMLVLAVRDVIPVADDQPKQTFNMLQHFIGFFTPLPKPTWVVEDGKVKTHIAGNPFLGVGPGWLLTEPENVVVLKGGTDIRRIVGPGAILTLPAEWPYQVIDLRNQLRIMHVNAHTQDGVEVNLSISLLFRIDPGYKEIDLKSLERQEPWPYRNRRYIFRITSYAEEVDLTEKTLQVHPWEDIPLKAVMNHVKQIISDYKLEQLYSVNPETGNLTRTDISVKVCGAVKTAVEPLGLEILGGGVIDKITPTNPDIIKQRSKVWKARYRLQLRKFTRIGNNA